MDLIEVTELHKKLRSPTQSNNVQIIVPKAGDRGGQVELPKASVVLDYINLLMKPEVKSHG